MTKIFDIVLITLVGKIHINFRIKFLLRNTIHNKL